MLDEAKYVYEGELSVALFPKKIDKIVPRIDGEPRSAADENKVPLQFATLKQSNQSEYVYYDFKPSEMILASSPTFAACDTGGPLIYSHQDKVYAVGMSVFNWATQNSTHIQRCSLGSVSFFLPIYNYLTWIRSQVENDVCI